MFYLSIKFFVSQCLLIIQQYIPKLLNVPFEVTEISQNAELVYERKIMKTLEN